MAFFILNSRIHSYISLLHNINDVCYISGEKLTDEQVDDIIRLTDLQEDLEGNVKYEGKSITKSHNDENQ